MTEYAIVVRRYRFIGERSTHAEVPGWGFAIPRPYRSRELAIAGIREIRGRLSRGHPSLRSGYVHRIVPIELPNESGPA